MKRPWDKKVRIFMASLCFLITCAGFSPLSASDSAYTDEEIQETSKFLLDPVLKPWEKPLDFGSVDYDSLGLTPGVIEDWEDGLRSDINPDAFSFEWWYFDAHFSTSEGEYSLVVVFYTKPYSTPAGYPVMNPYTGDVNIINPFPMVKTSLTIPGGETITKFYYSAFYGDFSAETDRCDVQMGSNRIFKNDGGDYEIHTNFEGTVVDLVMKNTVPAWRPGSGHYYYKDYSQQFAWLPAVPSGTITGTISYADPDTGDTQTLSDLSGSGYHDHNWGNIRMYDHMKYWWWSRTQTDDDKYTIITVNMREKNRYGYNIWQPIFTVLDENGPLIDAADKHVKVYMSESDIGTHPDPDCTEEIAHTVTVWALSKKGDWAIIQLDAGDLLTSTNLLPMFQAGMTGLEYYCAELIGMDPWYTRFRSTAQIAFKIGRKYYMGTGSGTLELMDLE